MQFVNTPFFKKKSNEGMTQQSYHFYMWPNHQSLLTLNNILFTQTQTQKKKKKKGHLVL